jgi:hypothetical protein
MTKFDKWCAELERAKTEVDRVRTDNSQKQKTTAYVPRKKDRPLRENDLPHWSVALYKRESENRVKLLKLSPVDWVERINRIEDIDVRAQVGRIIWWDYLGLVIVKHRTESFDNWLNTQHIETDDSALEQALHSCGYTPWHARNRISQKEFQND